MERESLTKNLQWFLQRMTAEQLRRVLWYARNIL